MPKPKRTPPPPVLTIGLISVDRTRQIVSVAGREMHLTPKETMLLWTLMSHADQVVTRAELMRLVWETDFTGDTGTLEVHMSWLRKKIEADPAHPVHLKTVRGQGYRFISAPPPIAPPPLVG